MRQVPFLALSPALLSRLETIFPAATRASRRRHHTPESAVQPQAAGETVAAPRMRIVASWLGRSVRAHMGGPMGHTPAESDSAGHGAML